MRGDMDDFTTDIPSGRQFIDTYGDGGFRIAGRRWSGSVLVTPEQTVTWSVQSLNQLDFETLRPLIDARPAVDVLLLGGGSQMQAVDAALRSELRNRGIVVEGMDTGAACRTFNVLMGENRRVAAALIAVS